MRTYFKILGQELGIINYGRLKIFEYLLDENPDSWPNILTPGNHHMGTTRMDNDPAHGVVDKNCKFHGLPNLFIAGSSCFPTGGAANPTRTVIALTLRLSDHIENSFDF